MNKGVKLFDQSKETKELERNPASLRRVHDFVTRYSNPDDPPFLDAEQEKTPTVEATQTFSFETEKHMADSSQEDTAPRESGKEQQETGGEPSRKRTIPFLQKTKQRRIKKTRVYIGQRRALATENTGKADVCVFPVENKVQDPLSSQFPVFALDETDHGVLAEQGILSKARVSSHHREQEPLQKFAAPGFSVKLEDTNKPHAVQRELDSLDPCLVSFLAPDSFDAEQYRVLRRLLERLRGERGHSCIVAVSSPSTGDGKTTTTLNLAGALAQAADARVLVIEADLRQPAVLERLGGQLAANRGLVNAVLHPRLRLQRTTMPYAFLNLTILPGGRLTSSSYEIFKSPRFGALLEEAQREYDYIILDTPPLTPEPDCRLIVQWVDGFFVVVAAHKTPRKLVQEALAVIPDEKILGLVFNGDTEWAQVCYDYAHKLEEETEKTCYDLFDIKKLSSWLDLSILVGTIKAVLFGRNRKKPLKKPTFDAERMEKRWLY